MTTTLAESGISAKDRTKPKRLEVMIVGPIGSRKTVTAHSLPNTRTLDFDDGLLSVEWAIRAGKLPKKLNEIVYKTMKPRNFSESELAALLDQACDQVDEWIAEEDIEPKLWKKSYPQYWDTLVIDSASFMSDTTLSLALKENNRLKLSNSLSEGEKGLDKATKDRGMYVVPVRIQDWGSANSLFYKAIRQWRALGKNIVLVCHEYEKLNDSGNVEAIQPNLIGGLRTKLPASFDEVWYAKIKPAVGAKAEEVVFRTASDSKREAKSRLGCLDVEEPADFQAIKAAIADFYDISPDILWVAYHGTEGRERAERELAEEAETI